MKKKFQKNLIVWKLRRYAGTRNNPRIVSEELNSVETLLLRHIVLAQFWVSEELNSVETVVDSHISLSNPSRFQKNLIVWKRFIRFRRRFIALSFQKNLIVWKRIQDQCRRDEKSWFQKNLIVWKPLTMISALMGLKSFRRT